MKSLQILVACLVAAASSAPSESAQPSMKFTAAPAVAANGRPGSDVRQYQRADTVTIVLRIPTACGLVPVNPSFKLTQDVLQLHYSVPSLETDAGATSCFSTAVFTLKGLPRRPLQVVPHRHRKPALIAAYEPKPAPRDLGGQRDLRRIAAARSRIATGIPEWGAIAARPV